MQPVPITTTNLPMGKSLNLFMRVPGRPHYNTGLPAQASV